MDAQIQTRQQQSSQLNSAIQHVNSVRRSLSQNASEVKSQIHAGISRHLEALRNREVWLLNQVDLMVNVKDDVLQRQQARLNQQLGILQSCLAYSEENEMKHLDEFSPSQLSDLKPEETPFIRFKSDSSTLRESIVTYGKIDGNGIVHSQSAFVDHKNPSTSLPRAFEDYDDGDHMMSYKTVQTDVHVFNRPISMKIPKLSTRPEDWLANSADTITTSTKSSPTFSFPHLSSKTSDWLMSEKDKPQLRSLPKSSTDSSIQNWLRQIKRNPVSEEEDFEIVASSSTPESELCDSMEWLNSDTSPEVLQRKVSPCPLDGWLKDYLPFEDDFQPHRAFAHYFREISTDMNRWLLSYHENMADDKEESKDENESAAVPLDHENALKWIYKDPQGVVQGPFPSNDMEEWSNVGYFSGNLLLKRCCDEKFLTLGELIKRWGRLPFLPGPYPPPILDKSVTGYSGTENKGISKVRDPLNIIEPPYVDMSRFLGDISAEKYKWLDERYHSSVEKLSHINNVCKTKKPCQGYKEGNITPKCPSLIEEISASTAGKQPAYLSGFEKYLKNDLSDWLLYHPESVQSTTNYYSPLFKHFTGLSSASKWLKEPEIVDKPKIPEFREMLQHNKDIRMWLKQGEDLTLPSPTSSWPPMMKGIHNFTKMSANEQWLSKEHSESLSDELK